MANTALIPALAKALIAIAWADGEIHREEETTLKEVLGLLPPMSAQEWAVIELYLIAPIAPDERAELVAQTVSRIRSAADKALALEAVDSMLQADGVVQPGEAEIAEEIRASFARVDVSLLAGLGRTIGAAFQGRPVRETGLEAWRANPAAYYLRVRGLAPEDELRRPEAEAAALAAGLMAQVVRLSPDGASRATPIMVATLVRDWYVSPALAEQIVAAALAVTRRDVDDHRVSRELVDRAPEAQRVQLLDTLFTLANASDRVSLEEIDTIRVIAGRLQLTQQQFIAAKLKIPAADRAGL